MLNATSGTEPKHGVRDFARSAADQYDVAVEAGLIKLD
jgi:hypothetical protein